MVTNTGQTPRNLTLAFPCFSLLLTMMQLPLIESGELQCAPFHPDFLFSGLDAGSVENNVNRSPYPMFHFLREVDVSRAVDMWQDKGGEMEDIWTRNAGVMNLLGEEGVDRIRKEGRVCETVIKKIKDEGFG